MRCSVSGVGRDSSTRLNRSTGAVGLRTAVLSSPGATATLSRSGAFKDPAVNAWAKRDLYRLARDQRSWQLDGEMTGIGLAALLDAMSSGDDAALVDLLARVSPEASEPDSDKHRQLQGAAGLADELVRRNRATNLVQISIALPADEMVASLEYFGGQVKEPASRGLLQPTSSPVEVADAFVENSYLRHSLDVQPALEVVSSRAGLISDEKLGAGSLTWLQANDPGSEEQLATLLEFVDRGRRSGTSDATMGAAADDGTLMHLASFSIRTTVR